MRCSVVDCEAGVKARGLCGKHYQRWKNHGDTEGGGTKRGEAWATFLRLTAAPEFACILWPLAKGAAGYGSIYFQGKVQAAHRVSCLVHHGPPPSGKFDAAHRRQDGSCCEQRSCINPLHLRWASRKDNSEDTVAHHHTTVGERSARALLSWSEVDTIRAEAGAGRSAAVLGRRFGVGERQIYKIIKGEQWPERERPAPTEALR